MHIGEHNLEIPNGFFCQLNLYIISLDNAKHMPVMMQTSAAQALKISIRISFVNQW